MKIIAAPQVPPAVRRSLAVALEGLGHVPAELRGPTVIALANVVGQCSDWADLLIGHADRVDL